MFKEQMAQTYKGPNEMELLQKLFDQTTCAYKVCIPKASVNYFYQNKIL